MGKLAPAPRWPARLPGGPLNLRKQKLRSMKFTGFIGLLCLLGWLARPAQAQQLPELDSVPMLLTSTAIQVECTQAINDMYNFKFGRAESIFQWLRRKYPTHPLPYFLMGLSQWWKIVPNIDHQQHDELFLAYMDSTIQNAEVLLDKDEKNVEAAFFLAASWGFKGRLYSERRNWTKATFAGKRAVKYMEMAADKNELSPELLFGDGLYNYYAIWVPENYPALKPVLWFFKKGNKELGIKQLEQTVQEAFYTKTEAQNFLMRIYADENQPERAFQITQYLHKTFPDNAYFHRNYARALYTRGEYLELEQVSRSIIEHIDQSKTGYEEISGRYAAFYLGHLYRIIYRDLPRAKQYYIRAVIFSEKIKSLEAGYYLHALAELGRIIDKEGDVPGAWAQYQKIVANAEKKHPTYKEAKDYEKKYKAWAKKNKTKA
jgi:hypothetical protein